jgi:hypothetical protein
LDVPLVALKDRESSTTHFASVLPLSRDADSGLLTFRRSGKACRLERMVPLATSATTFVCAARLVREKERERGSAAEGAFDRERSVRAHALNRTLFVAWCLTLHFHLNNLVRSQSRPPSRVTRPQPSHKLACSQTLLHRCTDIFSRSYQLLSTHLQARSPFFDNHQHTTQPTCHAHRDPSRAKAMRQTQTAM